MELIWGDVKGAGVLDYVCAWYRKAADYIKGTRIGCAFVSTNSISQGEQPAVLWSYLFRKHIKIHFGHRTFVWHNQASGNAHVHCVIIGFGAFDSPQKQLTWLDDNGVSHTETGTANLNPYLVVGSDLALPSRSTPINQVPPIIYGSKPADDGNLIIEAEDYAAFISNNPEAKPYVRQMVSTDEFLNGGERWCLWLVDAPPQLLRSCAGVRERVERTRDFRLASPKIPTQEAAKRPSLFAEIRQPEKSYVLIPLHTSETRDYIPFGFFKSDVIVHNSCTAIPEASLYHFGVLTSRMHMAWTSAVCGRIKSDYRYSNRIVYNNYPWPEPDAKQRSAIEAAAQSILDARAPHLSRGASLADLYDPLSMPAELLKAHQHLDHAVDRAYRPQPFTTDRDRVEYLFARYEQLTAPLAPTAKKSRSRR